MQYREELINIARNICEECESKKMQVMNKIQLHAISQIKNGYTSFRISRLMKDEESFLREWADMTDARVKVIKFKCFENGKKYLIKQFIVDLKGSIDLKYDLEGKTLIM